MLSLSKFKFGKVKMAVLALVACVGTLQTGCTDREIGAGIVGAMVGAILVDSANQPPPPPRPSRTCRVERIERCNWITNYYGHREYQCTYSNYDSCARHRRYKMSVGTSGAAELDIGTVASTYKLSEAGATKLVNALQSAQEATNDEAAKAAFASISIDLDEVKSLGKSGDPSIAMIDRLAQALNQDRADTAKMVTSIVETARAQEAARLQSLQN